MKKALPPIIAVTVILLSLTVVFGLQTRRAKNPPNQAAAQSSISLYPQIVTTDGQSLLELYLQIPPQSTPLSGLTLKATLSQPDGSPPLTYNTLEVNPDLIQKKWRFPKSEAVTLDNQVVISLIGLSFTIGGTPFPDTNYLIVTLPLNSVPTENLTLTLDPQISQISTQDGSVYTFKNAGQAIKVKVI